MVTARKKSVVKTASKPSVKTPVKLLVRLPAKPSVKPLVKPSSKSSTRSARLKQDIVIERVDGATTGAQAIAPDHSPRTRHTSSDIAIKPAIAMTQGVANDTANAAVNSAASATASVMADAILKEQVEQFLFLQSELLDNKNWQGFIDLFADDGVYWMPVLPEQSDWRSEASIFAEDKLMMEVRMGRVTHPTAWSQAPMWMTNHLVGNIAIESVSPSLVVVRSRFHLMELRRDQVRHFGGTYRHTLHRSKAGLRILMQRVDMFNAQAPYDYVLQVWV
jgi:3-phenylpropionate/cinnamic acid dioxygenase small subunit